MENVACDITPLLLGFYEIETPTLFKKTVESGAKEFLVPTRHLGKSILFFIYFICTKLYNFYYYIGKFYSLPQSPQQYKQLLMAGGMERYFQLARCYRDESIRPDRHPEFTQIDMELSFITPQDIYNVIEGLVTAIWSKALNIKLNPPFKHMSFDDAIGRFGVDKPDTRYGLEITDITSSFSNSNVSLFKNIGPKDRINIINAKGKYKYQF